MPIQVNKTPQKYSHLLYWKDFRTVFDDFSKMIHHYKKTFVKDGDKLIYLINRKHKNVNYSLHEVFYRFSGRISAQYKSYQDNLKFEKDINEFKFHIEKEHIKIVEAHTHIQDLMSKNEIYRIYTNTIQQLMDDNHNLLSRLLHIISVDLNAEVNDFIQSKKDFSQICIKILENISISLHIIYCNFRFHKEVNYNILEKLSTDNLQPWDIILFDEYKYYTSSYARKRIVKWIWSTILHSAIIYKKSKHNDTLVFHAGWDNRMKSYIEEFQPIDWIKYLILRYRKWLSKHDQKKMTKLIWKEINKKFSLLKLYWVVFNYWLMDIYNKFLVRFFPNVTVWNNPFRSSWIFCSEIISMIYRKFHKNVWNYTDNSMVSPIDIFNSFELEIIGYIDDNDKNSTDDNITSY